MHSEWIGIDQNFKLQDEEDMTILIVTSLVFHHWLDHSDKKIWKRLYQVIRLKNTRVFSKKIEKNSIFTSNIYQWNFLGFPGFEKSRFEKLRVFQSHRANKCILKNLRFRKHNFLSQGMALVIKILFLDSCFLF